jgi:hypothetical protein
MTRRKGTNIVQLIADNDLDGYYIHHRKQGKLICYDFVGKEVNEAIAKYEEYYLTA